MPELTRGDELDARRLELVEKRRERQKTKSHLNYLNRVIRALETLTGEPPEKAAQKAED